MARVVIPVVAASRAGATLTETNGDATNDHEFVNDGNTVLIARNSGAGARTVTLITAATVDGQAVADPVISIPAGETRYIGVFPTSVYNTAEGRAQIDVEHAEVKLSCLRLK